MSVSTGIAMEIHYCMGKKAGVDFYKSDSDLCGKCGMKENKSGCCSDDHKFYKLNNAHKNSSNAISFLPVGVINSVVHYLYPQQLPLVKVINNPSFQFDTGPSICVKNCIFRI